MITSIFIDTRKLDLFSDESIELNSSIASIEDITKNTTEYTKSFTVPATRNNNIIFKHYYNATIDNSFDARTKINGRIELGGIPFKYGKWKLGKVNVKQNKPASYTINFRGNLVSLKDKFKDDELSGLDLSSYNHLFTSDNVQTGLTSSLSSGDVIYNLLSKKQLYYNDDAGDNVNTETLANIAFGGGANTGVNWFDLKPSIKLSAIIDAIQTKYGITFSADFFGRVEFSDIMMWLNAESLTTGTTNEQLINYATGDIDDFGYNFTTDVWGNTQPANIVGKFYYKILITSLSGNIPYTIVVRNNGIQVAEFNVSGTFETDYIEVPIVGGVDTTFNYTFHVSASNSFSYESTLYLKQRFGFISDIKEGYTATTNFDYTFDIAQNMPKLKVIDFLKGLFSMFKLVVIADQNENVYVNTLNDYYAQGKLYDITRYIDFSSYDVERGNILNTIKFNFSEPTTILNNQFKLNTGIAYGDEETILEDADGEILDGDEFTIELPFEQIIYERLTDLNDGVKTNVMYGAIFDKEISPVNPKAHLFYNINQTLGAKTISFIDDTSTKIELDTINIPSHTHGFENPKFALLFSQEFSEWDGLIISDTLYTNYYQEYINSIFNIKRRTFKFNAKQIRLRILTKLQLNDVLKIRNDYYRIDNFNTNLLTKDTSFTLINSFNNNIDAIISSRLQIIADYKEQRQSVYVTNIQNKAFSYSVSWLTVSSIGDNIYFDFDENTTAEDRDVTVTIYNSVDVSKKVDIYIYQKATP